MTISSDMEKLFLHTSHRVVSTFAVIKCIPVTTSHNRNYKGEADKKKKKKTQKVPKSTKKPRVLCVTVQRCSGGPGFKASVHVCKGAAGNYEVRKSYRLKSVVLIEAFDDPRYPHPMFQIGFSNGRIAFECSTVQERAEIVGVIYSFCKSHEKVVPELRGIGKSDLGMYGESSGDEEDEEAWGVDGDPTMSGPVLIRSEDGTYETQQQGSSSATIAVSVQGVTPPVTHQALHGSWTTEGVSASHTINTLRNDSITPLKQHMTAGQENRMTPMTVNAVTQLARDAQRADILLDAVSEGAHSLEDACKRISEELHALEEANVHELLESYVASLRISDGLFSALGYLDDLEESIGMFDQKLRHLSQSMAVIEDSSSYTQNYSRNSILLLDSLDRLLDVCTIDSVMRDTLTNKDNYSMKMVDIVVQAADYLEILLDSISINAAQERQHNKQGIRISHAFSNMQVLRHLRQELLGLRAIFVENTINYFNSVISVLSLESILSDDEMVNVHAQVSAAAPLLHRVARMKEDLVHQQILKYISGIQHILRKKLDNALEECRYASKGSLLVKDFMARVDSVTALERVQTSNRIRLLDASSSEPSFTEYISGRTEISQNVGKDTRTDLSEIFANKMSYFVPCLFSEVTVILDLFSKVDISTVNLDESMSQLLSGFSKQFSSLISSLRSVHDLSCLGVAATLQHWIGRVRIKRHGQGVLQLLEKQLKECQLNWHGFCQDISKAIKKYEGQTNLLRGGASIHILPFVINFESIATKIESHLSSSSSMCGSAKTGPDPKRTLVSPFQSTDAAPDSLAVSGMADEDWNPQRVSPLETMRQMADDFYSSILPEIFQAVEHHALQNARHAQRIRMENYAFLRISLQSLPLKQVPVLKQYCTLTADSRNQSLKAYVDEQLKEAKLGTLLHLSEADFFDEGSIELAELLTMPRQDIETKVNAIRSKVQKDLSLSSPYLVQVVLDRIQTRCLQALEDAEKRNPDKFSVIAMNMRVVFSEKS